MICLTGLFIGFYGYLFPGNIILMIIELYHTKRYKFLLFSIVLIVLFESAYCALSLLFLTNLSTSSSLFKTLELASFILIATMGFWMLFEKKKNKLQTQKSTLFRGIFSIIFHPQQIPFWIIMGVVINKFIPLSAANQSLFIFVIFNAIGTFLALLFYMISSEKIMQFLKLNSLQLSRMMGLVYITIALFNFISRS